jgi:hypothetical protein
MNHHDAFCCMALRLLGVFFTLCPNPATLLDPSGAFTLQAPTLLHWLIFSDASVQPSPAWLPADVALITSLRDGMNLVSYEYVACQADNAGVLVLSEFAGAAQSLGAGAAHDTVI